MWTIHTVTLPTICGSALCEEKETRQYLYGPLFLPLKPSAIVCLVISSTWLLADLIQDKGSVWTKVLVDLEATFAHFLKVSAESVHC